MENDKEAVLFIGVICQLGGTSSGCDGQLSYEFKGKKVKLLEIKQVLKEHKLKKGIRKYARSNAYSIYKICLALGIEGNLAKKIQRLNPEEEFKKADLVWLSDFQVDSEFIPHELKKLIRKSFGKRPPKGKQSRKGRN